MPYILQKDRSDLGDALYKAYINGPRTMGEFNYFISSMIDNYLLEKGVKYENINALIGMLECAKLELYRRIAAPYEDKKMKENGDAYKSAP